MAIYLTLTLTLALILTLTLTLTLTQLLERKSTRLSKRWASCTTQCTRPVGGCGAMRGNGGIALMLLCSAR